MSSDHTKRPGTDAPEPTSTLGRARDKLAERLALTPHEGRRFIKTTKPLKTIDDLEESDLEALAVHFEAIYGLIGVRPPRMEEALDAWVSEIEGLSVEHDG